MALWESLSDVEREGELQLSDADRAELIGAGPST